MPRPFGKILLGAALSATLASAQAEFPEKPVNYIIPFGPGGESDISARMQQPFFQELTGQDLVIQYKPGGGGAVGWSQLNTMPADGYTIMGTNLPHIVMQPMQKDVGYTTDELANFFFFHYTPDAIVVTADSPFQTLQDLIDAANAMPGAVTFSGSGTYSANHIAKERFDRMANITVTYVPFKGTGASVTALLGKQVQAAWGYTTVGVAQGDKVRLLAVAMEERHPAFPDVPTFRELGYDLVSGAYRGMAVPNDTPQEMRQQLSDLFGQINQDPAFRQKMTDGGFAMIDVPLDEVEAFLAERRAEYEAIAQEMGLLP
ncbi:MAG: tripartite tricarboxylate transporter substrate binding protein [Candidatus Competibacterales bacterium]|nr:tripartite tricarboxylate transporter substrate binding protein [Candidatus Competibacterales bacterium]